MAKGFIGASGYKGYLGAVKLRKGYIGATRVYSAGNMVTYHVDSGVTYQEEVDDGATCLSPKTFTPAKSGWEFVGWRINANAINDVYTNKVMGDNPITLYAVFRKLVTVTYYNNSTSPSSTSGYRYYNNGNVVNPSFTLTQASSSWTPRGWSTSNQGNAGITYANGATFTRDSNITLYGLYQQTITVTYYNGNRTALSTSGTRYWAPAGSINPSFTLTQAGISGWTARGWSGSTHAAGDITYANGAAFTRDSNITLYGMYQQTVTVNYYNGSSSASSTNGTRYYNPGSGNVLNPSFTLTQAALSGWTARGWSTGNGATAGITYNNGASFTRDTNVTLYGMYYQTITLTTYNGSSAPTAHNGTRYYCPGSGSVVNPTFTVSAAALSGWSFDGWSTSSLAAAGIDYNSISGLSLASSLTLYGRYSQIITLSYNGNGASGGSTAAQSSTRYWNSGNVANPTFILRANGFSRSGYNFTAWALNGGTQYGAGASVTLAASATMYAVWTALDFVMDLDVNGWTKEIIQGGFADNGPTIHANPYGDGGVEVIGKGTRGATSAYDIGGFFKYIDTKGLSKMDINLGKYSGNRGIIQCGGVQVDLNKAPALENISIPTSSATQKLCLYINDGGDTYNTHSVIIRSIHFHN